MSDMLSNVRFNRCYGAYLGEIPASLLDLRGAVYHHSALAPGYCKKPKKFFGNRACWPTYQYNGRFGSGYVQFVHNWNSTEYVILMYYIRG